MQVQLVVSLITMDIHIAEVEYLVKLKKTMVSMMMILKFFGLLAHVFLLGKMFSMSLMVLMRIFIATWKK